MSPPGNLDGATGEAIITLLMDLRDRHGATLVLVTHAPGNSPRAATGKSGLRDARRIADDAMREAAE